MAISEKDILQILAWLEKSDWQELHLESGTFKLTVSKGGPPSRGAARDSSADGRSEGAPTPRRAPTPPAAKPTSGAGGDGAGRSPHTAKPASAEPVDPAWIAVRSPTLGNFYVAPQPGAPPFVTLGQEVGEDDTVAIVEVMKLMNHVKAGARGKIARICAENGELVEFEQVLFLVEPNHG